MTPFVFPRWANKTRALAGVILGGAPVYLTFLVWYGFSPKATDTGYEPKQRTNLYERFVTRDETAELARKYRHALTAENRPLASPLVVVG